MAYLLQSGDSFFPAPSQDSLLDKLPVGNYTVEESQTGMFFARGERFAKLGQLYGDHSRWADRIINTFQDRSSNTGVLLSGEKGSGKSLLGRLISQRASELDIPTIVINKPWPGDKLGPLLANLTSPAVIFFDEFEKIYHDANVQESVLSLMDGTSSTKHLYILTVNQTEKVNSHLKNRPGRLFYSIDFKGLDEQFIRDYAHDRLKDKSQVDSIVALTVFFEAFNFDMLKALVSEMNRYDEPASEAVKLLNVSPVGDQQTYKITIRDEAGVAYGAHCATSYSDHWRGNPLFLIRENIVVEPLDEEGNETDEDEDITLELTAGHLVSHDARQAIYRFKIDGWTVTFTGDRTRASNAHWSTLA